MNARISAEELARQHRRNAARRRTRRWALGACAVVVALVWGNWDRVRPALETLSKTDWPTRLESIRSIASTNGKPLDNASHDADRTPTVVQALVVESPVNTVMPRSYTGVLRATRACKVGFKTTGRVNQVHVSEGDLVTQGQLLATVDSRQINAEVAVLAARRAAAHAKLEELLAGPRKQTIAAAEAQVAAYQAKLEQARITFERSSRLIKRDAISQQDVDDSRLEVESLNKELDAKQQELNELQEGVRPEQIAAQRAVVKELDAMIASLNVQLDETRIEAPFDAIISERMVDEGIVVNPGEPILRLVENADPEAWIGVPSERASRITTGDRYEVTIHGDAYDGRVKAVLPELDPATRTRTVVLSVSLPEPNDESVAADDRPPQQRPAIGQLAQLELLQPAKQAGCWLPIQALARGSRGLWSAFLIEPHTGAQSDEQEYVVRKTDLEVIQVDSNRVLVRGTLQEGDRVVAGGVQKLTSGQRVRLANGSDGQQDPTNEPERVEVAKPALSDALLDAAANP